MIIDNSKTLLKLDLKTGQHCERSHSCVRWQSICSNSFGPLISYFHCRKDFSHCCKTMFHQKSSGTKDEFVVCWYLEQSNTHSLLNLLDTEHTSAVTWQSAYRHDYGMTMYRLVRFLQSRQMCIWVSSSFDDYEVWLVDYWICILLYVFELMVYMSADGAQGRVCS